MTKNKSLEEARARYKEKLASMSLLVYLMTIFLSPTNVLIFAVGVLLVPIALILDRENLRRSGFRGVSWSIIILSAWMFLSVGWAEDAVGSAIRVVRSVVLIYVIYWLVYFLPSSQVYKILKFCLGLSVVISLISVYTMDWAIHGREDYMLVGCWRGIFSHKNEAGAAAAAAILIFFWECISTRKLVPLLILFASILFLIGTKSATSGILVCVGLAVIVFMRLAKGSAYLAVFLIVGLIFIVLVGAALISDSDVEQQLFGDPYNFTGRVGLWTTVFDLWLEKPFLGHGFRTLFTEGSSVNLAQYALTNHTLIAPHAHNGYLDTMAGLGVVGLLLALRAFFWGPIRIYLSNSYVRASSNISVVAGIYVFLLFRAFFESNILQIDNSTWTIFVVVTALIQRLRRESNCQYE